MLGKSPSDIFKTKQRIIFSYLKQYIIVTLSLLFAIFFIYNTFNKSLQEKIESINNTLLGNIVNEIQNTIIKLDETLSTINSNNRLIRYQAYNDVSSPERIYLAYEIINDIGIYVNSIDSISDSYLMFQNDVVFTKSAKISKKMLLENYNVPAEEFENQLGTYKFRYFFKDGNDLYYINSLPLGNRISPKSLLVFNLNIKKMQSIINANLLSDNTRIFIIDSNGTILFDNTIGERVFFEFTDIDNEYKSMKNKNIISVIEFNNLNWRLVSIIPVSEYKVDLIILQKLIVYILLASLLFGISLAFYFAFRNYKNVARIVDVTDLNFKNASNNIFMHIENNIKKMIDENKILKSKLTYQTKHLNNDLIEQIVKKKFDNNIEIDELIKTHDIVIHGKSFVVLSVKLDKYGYNTDYSKIISSISELADEEKKIHVFFINTFLLVILVEIINIDSFSLDIFKEHLVRVLSFQRYNFIIGIGDLYYNIYDINNSYLESLACISTNESNKNSIIEFSKIKNSYNFNAARYFYPLKTEQDIIKLAKTGERSSLLKLLDSIYEINFKEIQISSSIAKVLINDIISTLLKILNEVNMDINNLVNISIINNINNAESADESFKLLEKTFLTLSSHLDMNKKSHNQDLFYKIEEHIKQNYTDKDISLVALAEIFKISVSYLSRFFKEQSGVNFNSYIHKLRIEKAKSLLESNPNLLINEVADKVGYNTTGSFIRIFQKFEGITPGEYKVKAAK